MDEQKEKKINPNDLPGIVENLQSQINKLIVQVRKLEDRTYEEVDNGISE